MKAEQELRRNAQTECVAQLTELEECLVQLNQLEIMFVTNGVCQLSNEVVIHSSCTCSAIGLSGNRLLFDTSLGGEPVDFVLAWNQSEICTCSLHAL